MALKRATGTKINPLTSGIMYAIIPLVHGGIAQLGERLNGIQEVSGSIPLISTRTIGAAGSASA